MTFNEMIQSDKTVLVDVDKNPQAAAAYQVQGVPTLIVFKKGEAFWRQSGIVPNAESVNIPLDNQTKEIAKFKDKKNIIVFCRSGNRSGMAKSLLEQQGFKHVINGGTWQNVAQFVH